MTPSKSLLLSSEARPGGRVRDFLERIVSRPQLHARFLNTLSLLEHIGSRKILLSQGPSLDTTSRLTQEVLQHLAEESRHACFFRAAAEKLCGRSLDYSEAATIAPASARMYFGRLDAAITRAVGKGRLAYLYVTLAVELRADWFYRIYEQTLHAEKVPLSLKRILAEEDAHLAAMKSALKAADPRYEEHSNHFTAIEEMLFWAWFMRTRATAFPEKTIQS